MKLQINYDLLEATAEAKVGFSLKRTARRIYGTTISASLLLVPLYFVNDSGTIEFTKSVLRLFIFYAGYYGLPDILLSKFGKMAGIEKLRDLSNQLKTININTNEELLMKSEEYKTEYKLVREDSKLPKIKQNKYIKTPVYNYNGEEKEASLLQEHVIGTKEYHLSYGEPKAKKVYKLSYNPI